MPIQIITIDNIFGGRQESEYFGGSGQFLESIAIDPDMPKDDSSVKPSGLIRPTAMAKFSASEITGVPLWMISNPKDTNTYVYANDGKVHVINSSLTMGTALNGGATITAGAGNGLEYYNNYLYITVGDDVARYGPLDGSPALDDDWWTTVVGLTALTDTTYPSINGVEMPNHAMHRHTDNKLYFLNVVGNQGFVHIIKTSKTTAEGDTDDGSVFAASDGALDYFFGLYPTAIETYNDGLAIAVIEGVNTSIRQKNAKLSFWDTTSDSFDKITDVEFPDPLITAVKNVNGVLWVFSGSASKGCRVSKFIGGYTLQEVTYLPDVYPPLPGAVDHFLNRVVFGTNTTTPEVSASVFAIGAKELNLTMGVHNIARSIQAGANPWVTCLKFIDQSDGAKILPVIGVDNDTGKGLEKISTNYGDANVWQSSLFRIGRKFNITKIKMPLAQAVAANMTLVVKAVTGDGATIMTLGTINITNYPNSETEIDFYPKGEFRNNFYLQLEWSGSALLTVGLPITIELNINEN